MLSRSHASLLAGVSLFSLASAALTVPATGTILRIMDGVYTLNVGKADGVTEGQEVAVVQGKETLGRLRVTVLRENDADATLIEIKTDRILHVGDTVIFEATAPPSKPTPPGPMPPAPPPPPPVHPKIRPAKPPAPKTPPPKEKSKEKKPKQKNQPSQEILKAPAQKSPMPVLPGSSSSTPPVDSTFSPYALSPGTPLISEQSVHTGAIELFPPGPNEERVAGSLTDLGFENVFVAPTADNGVYAEFENRKYRWEVDGLGEVMRSIASVSGNGGLLTLIGKQRNVPVYEIQVTLGDFRAYLKGEMTDAEFRQHFYVTRAETRGKKGQNSSYRRMDATLGNAYRANFTSTIGAPTPGVQGLLRLGLESDLAKGLRARYREWIPLNKNEFFGTTPSVDTGELSYLYRFSPRLYGTAYAGQFSDAFGGVRGEATYFASKDDALDVHVGKVGNGLGDLHQFAYLGTWRHQLPTVDAQIYARAGKYLYGDTGHSFGFRSQFRERSYEFAYTKTDLDKLLTFTLRWPLGQSKYSDPNTLRFRSERQLRIRYNQKAGTIGTLFPDDGPTEDWQIAMLPSVLPQYVAYLRGGEARADEKELMQGVKDIPLSAMVGPSLSGSTGLWFVPTAEVVPYGYWTLGANWVHKDYRAKQLGFSGSGTTAQYFTFGALPHLEITLSLTNQSGRLGVQKYNSHSGFFGNPTGLNVDREVSAQYLLWPEKRNLPAALVGAQDFLGDLNDISVAAHYKAYYGIVSKHFGRLGLHAGAGTDTLKGALVGADWAVSPRLKLIADHRRGATTLGARVEAIKNVRVDVYDAGMKKPGAGLTYTRRM